MSFLDPLDLWRATSLQAKGLWQAGIKLAQGRRVNASDWEVAGSDMTERAELLTARGAISERLSNWMVIGQVRPVFRWNAERKDWEISIAAQSVPHLFGLLAVSLTLAVSDKDGFAICLICKRWYMPSRRPAASRKSYCTREDCQKGKWREYKREKE